MNSITREVSDIYMKNKHSSQKGTRKLYLYVYSWLKNLTIVDIHVVWLKLTSQFAG